MFKADLHIHTKEDLLDRNIKYSYKTILKLAKKKRFSIISFTFHEKVFWKEEFSEWKDILIIPGIEANVEGNHILIYTNPKNVEQLKQLQGKISFDKLYYYKEKFDFLVGAPHPFYPKLLSSSLGEFNLLIHRDLFDFIEYSGVYTKNLNWFNKKALEFGSRFNIPVIANSDSHFLFQFNKTFTVFLDHITSFEDLYNSIKKKRFFIKTKPLNFFELLIFSLGI